MWWKFPLLLLLGAPLVFRALHELQDQPNSIEASPSLPSSKSLDAKKTEQKKLADELKDQDKLVEDLEKQKKVAEDRDLVSVFARAVKQPDLVTKQNSH